MSLFLNTIKGERSSRIPSWMMRQAGRYQPEYMAIKNKIGGFFNLCRNPEAIAEATHFAQHSLGADAAIIFSDITFPSWAMGMPLEFQPGPTFSQPIRTLSDVQNLEPLNLEKIKPLKEGIELTKNRLDPDCALIGFIGAPFTVGAYMVEGKPNKHWAESKTLLYKNPECFAALIEKLVTALSIHAIEQIKAGCQAIQIFESNAFEVQGLQFNQWCLNPVHKIVKNIKKEFPNIPIIYFARNISGNLETILQTLPVEVVALDYGCTFKQAQNIQKNIAIKNNDYKSKVFMGNLDPLVLYGNENSIRKNMDAMYKDAQHCETFIFNLGHGILKETKPEMAKFAFDYMKEISKQ